METELSIERGTIIELLLERDGDRCQYPSCDRPFADAPFEDGLYATIDHWMPQWFCKEQGWTFEEMWDLDNLKLMHRVCNAKKGDLIPNDDGTLPDKVPSARVLRARAKAARPALCDTCINGRLLLPSETCPDCGSEAQPKTAPRTLQVKPKECDHDKTHCWMCFIGHVPRVSALDSMIASAVESVVDPGDD